MTTMDVVRDLVQKWRDRRAGMAKLHEFDGYDPRDLDAIARDLRLSVNELREVVADGEHADDLMRRMMWQYGLDPEKLDDEMPAVMRDIEVICSRCGAKGRCERELRDGTAAGHAHDFCPNALTFDTLR